jgi:hypothetical protein
MQDASNGLPKKSPITLRWIGLVIFGVIVAHFVANYDRYLPHSWQTYTPADGSFSIQLPAKPSIESTNVPIEGGGTTKANVISAAPNDHTVYMITYVEEPSVGQRSPDQTLDAARDGGLGKIQGTALSQKKITVQGYPGLDIQARARGNSLADFRIVVAGNRMFMIMAVATVEADREPKTIQRMFDSFKISQK